jgi:hypothetical protein
MPGSPIKVLFIAGAGRSGSTLVDMILGQLHGFVSVGELRYIWQRGFLEDRLCGCGERFSACPFWVPVIGEAVGSSPNVDPHRVLAELRRRTRIRHLPRLLRDDTARFEPEDDLGRTIGSLYRAVRDRSGASLIVDSSKLPSYGRVIDQITEIELSVLHLVRDPRATAYSWTRKRQLPDKPGQLMQQQKPAKSAALWYVWNWTTERLWARGAGRYLRLRYEDFVHEPRHSLERILELVDETGRDLPFVTDDSVELRPTHIVAGNPSRFRHGVVEIRADDEWRTHLSPSARRTVEAIAWPLMRRYGYASGGPSARP